MGFFSSFFKSDVKSGENAKNRLKVAITSDRAVCSPEIMEQMKNEIIQVISKYVEIDVDGLDIKVKQMELEDGAMPVNAVMANIPIKGSRNFRKSQQH
ncbi:MAG: cell division topological specificity factor MinE [Lachnospiraceae bacterium]|nr:cell division topological specificity factor MinE [Lachnospiraceae bacterium]